MCTVSQVFAQNFDEKSVYIKQPQKIAWSEQTEKERESLL